MDAALGAAAEALASQRELAEAHAEGIQMLSADLEARERRIGELEQVSDHLAERVVQRERELVALRAELDRALDPSAEVRAATRALGEELEVLRRQARGQATRIRMSALRQAAALTKRLDRPDLAAAGQSVVSDAEADGELFEGSVEVDVGPLADFAKLVGFEDAARSIAGAADISIKRFSGGRATLAMTLSEPVRLLRELERRSDLEFRVRDTRSDKLVLDVEDDPAP